MQGEDIEIAAQGSYAYWLATLSADNPPSEQVRNRMALREARRHVFRVKYEDAVVNLKNTCKYRKVRPKNNNKNPVCLPLQLDPNKVSCSHIFLFLLFRVI